MAVNENKWGLLYCPRGGWRSSKRWEKIEKVLKQQGVDYDFVQSENQKSVERLVKMFAINGIIFQVFSCTNVHATIHLATISTDNLRTLRIASP